MLYLLPRVVLLSFHTNIYNIKYNALTFVSALCLVQTIAISPMCLSVTSDGPLSTFSHLASLKNFSVLCCYLTVQMEAEQHGWGVSYSMAYWQSWAYSLTTVILLHPWLYLKSNTPSFVPYLLETTAILLFQHNMTIPWCLRVPAKLKEKDMQGTYPVVGNSRQNLCRSHCCPPPGSWGSSRTCWGYHLTHEGAHGPAFAHGSPWR